MKKTSQGTDIFEVDSGKSTDIWIPVASVLNGKYKLTWKYTLEKIEKEITK